MNINAHKPAKKSVSMNNTDGLMLRQEKSARLYNAAISINLRVLIFLIRVRLVNLITRHKRWNTTVVIHRVGIDNVSII
jgi:hypothetical protein